MSSQLLVAEAAEEVNTLRQGGRDHEPLFSRRSGGRRRIKAFNPRVLFAFATLVRHEQTFIFTNNKEQRTKNDVMVLSLRELFAKCTGESSSGDSRPRGGFRREQQRRGQKARERRSTQDKNTTGASVSVDVAGVAAAALGEEENINPVEAAADEREEKMDVERHTRVCTGPISEEEDGGGE